MAPSLTRREALGGAAAALVLGSCGGGDPPPRQRAEPGLGRRAARSLLALEHATVAAYGACEEVLRGDALAQARAIREQERGHARRPRAADHRARRRAARQAGAPRSTPRTFPRLREPRPTRSASPTTSSSARCAPTSTRSRTCPRPRLRQAAADIGADEAEHLAAVRVLRGLPAAEGPFVTGAL